MSYSTSWTTPITSLQIDLAVGWLADFPRPATFLADLFSCPHGLSATNRGAYCNPQLDDLMAAAEAEESRDLITASRQWQQIEQQVTADAPIIPTVDTVDPYLTATGVGNSVEGPLIIPPLDQMWVH